MAKVKPTSNTAKNPDNSDEVVDKFMRDINLVWDEDSKVFKTLKNEPTSDLPESPMNYKDYVPLLKMLYDNKSKLEALLTSKKATEYQYQIKGKRGTKTIFISVNLANLINLYSSESSTPMSIIFETAIINFLINNGYDNKIKEILDQKP